jgi:hypothetical protein
MIPARRVIRGFLPNCRAASVARSFQPLSGGVSRPCSSGRSGVAAHLTHHPSAAHRHQGACRGGSLPHKRMAGQSNRPNAAFDPPSVASCVIPAA